MCPECGSDHITIEEYDFGIRSQTGYHDAGERFRCHSCGANGDAADAADLYTDGSFQGANAGALPRRPDLAAAPPAGAAREPGSAASSIAGLPAARSVLQNSVAPPVYLLVGW